MTIQPHHIRHSAKIIGLAVITFVIAGAIVFLFPRLTIAPTGVPVTSNPEPEQQPETGVITLNNLMENDRVTPGEVITGEVPGRWFFEASFPVELRDINGAIFATTYASTTEDWMTTENVSFTITLPASFSYTGVGELYLKKDDPSDGEAPFDPATDEATIHVIFE